VGAAAAGGQVSWAERRPGGAHGRSRVVPAAGVATMVPSRSEGGLAAAGAPSARAGSAGTGDAAPRGGRGGERVGDAGRSDEAAKATAPPPRRDEAARGESSRGGGGGVEGATAASGARDRAAAAAAEEPQPGDRGGEMGWRGGGWGRTAADAGGQKAFRTPAVRDWAATGGRTTNESRALPAASGVTTATGRPPATTAVAALLGADHDDAPSAGAITAAPGRRAGAPAVGGDISRPVGTRSPIEGGGAGVPLVGTAPPAAMRKSATAASAGEYARPARSASTREANAAAGTIAVRPPMPRPPCETGSAARMRRASTTAGASRASVRRRRTAP